MVLIEEVAATPDAVCEKVERSVPDTNDASAGDKEREQAFMRALNLSDDAQEMLAKAVALAKSDASTVSCTREGWWYESEERAAKHMQIGLERLQGVAKASGDGAAKAGDWDDALEHYFSAMEVRRRARRHSVGPASDAQTESRRRADSQAPVLTPWSSGEALSFSRPTLDSHPLCGS